jgi:hypothetical protein
LQRIYKNMSILISLAIIYTVFLANSATSTFAADAGPEVFPVQSSPYELSYKGWLAKWWQWYISIPTGAHPNTHLSPENCAINQSGPVWFLPNIPSGGSLASPIVHRCVIPAGKAIAFTIETGECDRGMQDMTDDQKMINCATVGNDPAHFATATYQASIDGVKLSNLNQYRVQTDFFNINIPPNNIYQSPSGTFKAIASGFIVIVKPLPPGAHKIAYQDFFYSPLPTDKDLNHSKFEVMDLLVK